MQGKKFNEMRSITQILPKNEICIDNQSRVLFNCASDTIFDGSWTFPNHTNLPPNCEIRNIEVTAKELNKLITCINITQKNTGIYLCDRQMRINTDFYETHYNEIFVESSKTQEVFEEKFESFRKFAHDKIINLTIEKQKLVYNILVDVLNKIIDEENEDFIDSWNENLKPKNKVIGNTELQLSSVNCNQTLIFNINL